MGDVIQMTGEPGPCVCDDPEPTVIGYAAALECANCRRPMVPMTLNDLNERVYSLNEVARLFRTAPAQIKRRALAGEFPYKVNARGHFEFSRESLLLHMDELTKRNNRLG